MKFMRQTNSWFTPGSLFVVAFFCCIVFAQAQRMHCSFYSYLTLTLTRTLLLAYSYLTRTLLLPYSYHAIQNFNATTEVNSSFDAGSRSLAITWQHIKGSMHHDKIPDNSEQIKDTSSWAKNYGTVSCVVV
jgi:hypothetical protein